ncbi:MAG: Nif3-like dinuclear metal center hexameric protein [Gemmatimonadaceae bacterium]
MTETATLADYLDVLLETARIPDYPGALNGLQLGNSGSVNKIAAAVDFSSRTVAAAIEQQANLLLVHHGMFWSGTRPLTGRRYELLRSLIENDVAVYSSHLPLDCHRTFGNNVLLSRELGLESSGTFAAYKGFPIGVRGSSNVATADLAERARQFAARQGGVTVITDFEPDAVSTSWAICTGSGASADTLQEAAGLGVNTLIVGEGPHWTAVEANEIGITIIYAGHYATETLGVSALAEHLAQQFHLDWIPIHAPTGL